MARRVVCSNPVVVPRVRSLGLDMRSALHLTRSELRVSEGLFREYRN